MATFITKRCAYLSYVIIFYGVYFFIIVPLVWGRVKPEIFIKGSKDQYHLIFWCTVLLLFLVIILGSWLSRKLCCWNKIQDGMEYNTHEAGQLVGESATVQSTVAQPTIAYPINGHVIAVNEKKTTHDSDSENDDVFYRSAECLETLRSSEIGTQTESLLTPRDEYFYSDNVDSSGTDPFEKRRTSALSSMGYRRDSFNPQRSRQPSLLMSMDELIKHNQDLSKVLKRLNSKNEETSLIDITKEFLEREQKKTTDFLKLSSRGYLIRLKSTASPRSTLKSEIHIDIGDC